MQISHDLNTSGYCRVNYGATLQSMTIRDPHHIFDPF